MKIPDCGGFITSEYAVSTGCYVKTDCCTECEWFEQPFTPMFIRFKRDVCPTCGGRLVDTVGQYVIETKPKFLWFGGETNIIAFKRKE